MASSSSASTPDSSPPCPCLRLVPRFRSPGPCVRGRCGGVHRRGGPRRGVRPSAPHALPVRSAHPRNRHPEPVRRAERDAPARGIFAPGMHDVRRNQRSLHSLDSAALRCAQVSLPAHAIRRLVGMTVRGMSEKLCRTYIAATRLEQDHQHHRVDDEDRHDRRDQRHPVRLVQDPRALAVAWLHPISPRSCSGTRSPGFSRHLSCFIYGTYNAGAIMPDPSPIPATRFHQGHMHS